MLLPENFKFCLLCRVIIKSLEIGLEIGSFLLWQEYCCHWNNDDLIRTIFWRTLLKKNLFNPILNFIKRFPVD